MAENESDFSELEKRLGVSRRTFLKFCAGVAASLGLPAGAAMAMAQAVADPKKRPPVIWLHGQECTGPSESLLRSEQPSFEHLILDLISLDYHQTLDAGAGHQVEEIKKQVMKENQGKYLLVVEGAIPVKDNGIFCKIAGETMLELTHEAAEHAAAIVAFGSCASWGGVQAAAPNPTGAQGAPQVLKGKTVVTIPGCPPNPANFIGTVLYFVTYGKLPPIDDKGRPKWAYGRLIHENCYRRPHFDAGRFATGDLQQLPQPRIQQRRRRRLADRCRSPLLRLLRGGCRLREADVRALRCDHPHPAQHVPGHRGS